MNRNRIRTQTHDLRKMQGEGIYNKPIRCSKCGGRGFIIGNAEEVIKILDIAIQNRTPLSISELKQIRRTLEHKPEQAEKQCI